MVNVELEPKAIVLGSFRRGWSDIRLKSLAFSKHGWDVVIPRGFEVSPIGLSADQQFLILNKDLEDAGITQLEAQAMSLDSLRSLITSRKLQRRVLKEILGLKKTDIIYTVIGRDGFLGKSTAYEIAAAVIFDKSIILQRQVSTISPEVDPITTEFLEKIIPQLTVVSYKKIIHSKKANITVSPLNIELITEKKKRILIRQILMVLLRSDNLLYPQQALSNSNIPPVT